MSDAIIKRIDSKRRPIRSNANRLLNELTTELANVTPDLDVLQLHVEDLEDVMGQIRELDKEMQEAKMDKGVSDAEYKTEYDENLEYQHKLRSIRLKVNKVLPVTQPHQAASASPVVTQAKYTLPQLQIKQFNGELIEWLGFWSQFKKVHEDPQIDPGDKLQYLVQSMKIGTRARELVESYPQTGDNYPKAIQSLEERFGDKNLLVEVYARSLFQLAMSNVASRGTVPVAQIYDRLEIHLRALDSLGKSEETGAVILFSLVESSLPEEILRAWQRNPLSKHDGSKDTPPRSRLTLLMEFLQGEVQSEQRIALAQKGYGDSSIMKSKPQGKDDSNQQQKKNSRDAQRRRDNDVPTVAGLHAGEEEIKCIFCSKHRDSVSCGVAQNMTLAEKDNIIKQKRVCYLCLRPGHQSNKCKAYTKCVLCSKKHLVILCPELPAHQKKGDKKTQEKVQETPTFQTVHSNLAMTQSVTLGVVVFQLWIGTKNGRRKVRALLDSGAQRSYILKKLAEELQLMSIGEEFIVQSLFGGVRGGVTKHKKYRLEVPLANGKGTTVLNLMDQDKICGKVPRMSTGPWLKELKDKKIWISDMGEDTPEIEILIGADLFGKLLTGNIHQLQNGLTALETVLGWILMGETTTRRRGLNEESVAMTALSNQVSEASIEQLWSLETIGIKDPSESLSKEEKERATKDHFLKTVVRLEDGRYSVRLPWINGTQKIPNNWFMAEKMLRTTTRKLLAIGVYQKYEDVFLSWLKEGIIEEVPLSDMGGDYHYLPHRAVVKPESLTTPIRPVFNASYKAGRSPSLNECLEKGPNLLELIPSILLKFREKKIGGLSDIRRAFQMIEVQKDDRDYLRFLWWEESQDGSCPYKLRVFRHKRVVFGVNCSPFLLAAVIEFHLGSVNEDLKPVADKLLESLYVDNCVISVDTMEEYLHFKDQATAIMQDAKMELRMWQCNSGEGAGVGSLTSRECGLEPARVDTANKDEVITSVLGLKWDMSEDTLCCDFKVPEMQGLWTKRKVLSNVQHVFDPTGVTCPALLFPKLILQEAWSLKTGWDVELSKEKQVQFGSWYDELSNLKLIKIPRNFTQGLNKSREKWAVHTFCDASKAAYAAVCFLRIQTQTETSVQLLQAKSRVAPLKKTTIPRLELLACTIGARLTDSIRKSLSLEDVPIRFWSDSTTALAWIQRNDEWGTFVGNRVREILKLTDSNKWKHVPGKHNPADLPSRGCTPVQLLKSKWWEGPTWLKDSEENWPTEQCVVNEEEVLAERKKGVSINLIVTSGAIPWYGKHSSYYKNVRSMCWVLRYIHNLRKLATPRGHISVQEIECAENVIIKLIQKESFCEEDDIISGIRVQRNEQGIIQVKTKLTYRDDEWGFKFPALLPHAHPIVDQIITEEHLRHGHAGIQFLMGRLREKFWILQGRKAIRKIVSKCVICRRFTSKKIEAVPAPLPKDRVTTAKAFEVTGVDLAGPLFTKDMSKVWIVIYTCAVYRCVHLDLVQSLSTESFLESLERFINRRGRPTTIHSDNGTNFVGAANAFKTIDWDRVSKFCGLERINWRFNPPSAAWWGGWWERLIRTLKDLLRRMLEAVMNGRPLTTVTEDPNDLIPLTPSMFLHELHIPTQMDLDFLNAQGYQDLYKKRKSMLDELKARFRKEYLGQLVQRQNESVKKEVAVGEVVLVGSDNKKRWEWPLGRVIELLPGKDGHPRVANVKTAHGVLMRPIQRLYPLEVSSPLEFPEVPSDHEDSSTPSLVDEEPEVRTRSGRRVNIPARYKN